MTNPKLQSTISSWGGGPIRAVVFDAVGTVIYAMPSVTSTYCRILERICGQPVDLRNVQSVLSVQLAARSADSDLTTSEDSERRFWQNLIYQLVNDPAKQELCFEALYQHFSLPQHWRCYEDVSESLRTLQTLKLKLVIASNFDQRLHSVCDGLEDLAPITDKIISSEVGWRKPAREFFDIVCERTNCRPDEILFVGDDPHNDIQGARLAGMPAVWIDRRGAPTGAVDPAAPPNRTDQVWKINSLLDLVWLVAS